MRPRLAATLLLAHTLTACVQLDVSQPIEILPRGDWAAEELSALNHAAKCWNRQVGTQLVVGPGADAPQRVEIAFDELACFHAEGFTQMGKTISVWICPPRLWHDYGADQRVPGQDYGPTLYKVIQHELGHVLNIRTHGASGVMAGNEVFTDEDIILFRGANPDFALTKHSCVAVPWDDNVDGPCECAVTW